MTKEGSWATVNVIIPVFNRICYLGETIRSVLSQSYERWRLTVVDDGSTEDVGQVLARFNDPRIQFVRQHNLGNSAARNTGILQTSGDYVICLDSDDIWQPEMLAASVNILEFRPNIDVVYSQRQLIDANGQLLPRPPSPEPYDGHLLDILLMGYPILPSSALVRRTCFERWGLFTPGLDDWELWLRWAAQGCYFHCLDRPLLNYRIHGQNLNLDWDKRRQTHLSILDLFFASANVPGQTLAKKNLAYANQHLHFSEMAWRAGRASDGISEFIEGVQHNPDYLSNVEVFYRLACAHQQQLDAGTRNNLNLDEAERTLIACLDGLFAQPSLAERIRKQRNSSFAYAYFSLGRLAYSVPKDMAKARGFLRASLGAWPAITTRTDWIFWLVQSLIGYRF